MAADLREGRVGRAHPLPVPTASTPSGAINARGAATVAFLDTSLGSWQLAILERPPGGDFGAVQRVAVAGSMLSLDAIRDAREGSALLWLSLPQEAASAPRSSVDAVSRPPGGSYGVPRTLSTPGAQVVDTPVLAADADGNAIAAWIEGDARPQRRIMVAERRAGGEWRRPGTVLTTRWRIRHPDVALNDRGEGAVVVSAACNLRAALMTVRRSSSRAWARPNVAASWAGYPASASIGIDSRGALTALWLRRKSSRVSQDGPVFVATQPPE